MRAAIATPSPSGGGSGFETGVTITGNFFTRSTNQGIRTAGETLSRVRGSVQGNEFNDGAYLDLQNLNLPAASPVSPTNALGITGGNTFTLLQGGFGIVVRDGQTLVNLANLIITNNYFDGGLAVVNEISANNSVLSFGSNVVNDVTFDTLTGGAEVDAFVFAKLGAADTITDLNQLAPADFSTAFDPGTRIIYNGNALWYNAEGVAGGAVKITDFNPAASPAPLASNILIF